MWQTPRQTAAGREALERPEYRKEYISATFTALSKLLDGEEYDDGGLGFGISGLRTGL